MVDLDQTSESNIPSHARKEDLDELNEEDCEELDDFHIFLDNESQVNNYNSALCYEENEKHDGEVCYEEIDNVLESKMSEVLTDFEEWKKLEK